MNNHVIVEFVGLPGSGKSTVTRGFPDSWMRRSSFDVLKTDLSLRFSFCKKSFRFVASLRPCRIDDIRRAWRLSDQLKYYTHEERRPLVLDQGILQKLWSCMVWRRDFDRSELVKVIDFISPFSPDIVVWLHTPLDEVLNRISTRRHGRSRFDKRSVQEIRPELEVEERKFNLLLDIVRERTKSRVIELSGEEPPESNTQTILNSVLDLFHPSH